MRRDKTVARILLIFSAANVVLASPAVVRQSHVDVAKAASEKRANDLPPPESETFHPAPFEHFENMMKWVNSDKSASESGPALTQPESSSAAANRIITTQASGSSSSSYDNPPPDSGAHLPPPPPPPRPLRQGLPPSVAVPQTGRFLTNELKYKLTVGGLVTGILLSGGLGAYSLTELMYVSPLSPLSLVFI